MRIRRSVTPDARYSAAEQIESVVCSKDDCAARLARLRYLHPPALVRQIDLASETVFEEQRESESVSEERVWPRSR